MIRLGGGIGFWEEDYRVKWHSHHIKYKLKSTYCQLHLLLLIPTLTTWLSIVCQVFTCKVNFFILLSIFALWNEVTICNPQSRVGSYTLSPWGQNAYINYLFFYIGDFVSSPFICSLDNCWQYGLTDIYFIHMSIILYYFNVLFKLPLLGHWELLQLAGVSLSLISIILSLFIYFFGLVSWAPAYFLTL